MDLIKLTNEILIDMAKIINVSSFNLSEWTFEITKTKNLAGKCYYRKKIIQISNNSYNNNIKNTLVHELLHALNPNQHHTGSWKKQAEILNSNKEFNLKYGDIKRVYTISPDIIVQEYKYRYKCNCGKIHYANKKWNYLCKITREILIWEKNV